MSATYYLIYDAKSALKFLFSDSDDKYSHLKQNILHFTKPNNNIAIS